MKTTFLRNTLLASAIVGGFMLTSCKEKTETTTETETIDTIDGTDTSPIDTVVTDNDTIIDTGNASKPNENPVGTQVP